jgi:hypothetical protein
VSAHDERTVDGAAREHLHGPALANEPVREHGVRVDLTALEDLPELLDVHHRVLHAVAVREALELRHTALERHLPALEAELRVVLGEISLGAAAGGLAANSGAAAPNALPGPPRALGRV